MDKYFRGWTRKANAPNNRSPNNVAAQRAAWNVRSKFGRAAQTRVANTLKPQEGRHNYVAKSQQSLAEKYKAEYAQKIAAITPEQKTGLASVANEINHQLATNEAHEPIRLSISRPIARVLLFAIGLAMMTLLVGTVILDLVFLPNGSLTSAVAKQSLIFMGLSAPMRPINQLNNS